MQTWVTLAAKHATLASGFGLGTIPAMGWDSLDGVAVGFLLAGAGFAAVNSSRQARSCPLPPAGRVAAASADSGHQHDGALTRIRRRVDGLLTSMLSDDAEPVQARPPVLVPLSSGAEPPSARPAHSRQVYRGDFVDAITGPAGSRTERSRGQENTVASARPERVGSWPYLTVVRDTGGEPEAAVRPATRDADPAYWGSRPPQPASGDNRWKHRSEDAGDTSAGNDGGGEGRDPGASPRSGDRKRPAPRHAAPSAGFGATLGRRLASPRLTSKSAAHAG